MSNKAFGTGYVPKALSELYTLTNLDRVILVGKYYGLDSTFMEKFNNKIKSLVGL